MLIDVFLVVYISYFRLQIKCFKLCLDRNESKHRAYILRYPSTPDNISSIDQTYCYNFNQLQNQMKLSFPEPSILLSFPYCLPTDLKNHWIIPHPGSIMQNLYSILRPILLKNAFISMNRVTIRSFILFQIELVKPTPNTWTIILRSNINIYICTSF